jgi:transcriptional regulator with GAF, ATPase, and Fis domain
MVDRIDPAASARSVGELRRADLASGELESSLRAVADATSAVFASDGGGIMLLDDQQALHYVGATSGRAAALEAAQEETGEGPCVDSLMNDEVVFTNDLSADDRWPNLRGQIEGMGIRAILGVPLRLGLAPVGSLNVYRGEPWEWREDDVAAISAHGQIVEEVLAGAMLAQRQHTLVAQLRDALQHRILIERAVGVVIASRQLDPVHAFNELRSLARARRVRVAELAEEVVAARSFPPGPT